MLEWVDSIWDDSQGNCVARGKASSQLWQESDGDAQGKGCGCVCVCVCVCVCMLSCVWLLDPINCSPPGSFVHVISQPRILEWVSISSSRCGCVVVGSSHCKDYTGQHLSWISPQDGCLFPLIDSPPSTTKVPLGSADGFGFAPTSCLSPGCLLASFSPEFCPRQLPLSPVSASFLSSLSPEGKPDLKK